MQEYDAKRWEAARETRTFSLKGPAMVIIQVSCTKEVKLYGLSKGKKVLLKAGPEFTFRGTVKGFNSLQLSGTGKTEYGFSYRARRRLGPEENNGEKPAAPPMPDASANMILKINQMMRQTAAAQRYPVLDQDDFPSFGRYELDDDALEEFEEEQFDRIQAEKAEAARIAQEEAEKAKLAVTPPEPPGPPPEPSAGDPPPGDPPPPPSAS